MQEGDDARVAAMFADAKHDAGVLVLAGDLTGHGTPGQTEARERGTSA